MARAMKDSGIEWIGEIPEGWKVARVSSCFSEVKEKNIDNLYDNALQFKMGRIIPKPRKWDAEEIGETYSAYTIVHPGTIMVNGLNLEFDFVTQRVAIVEEDGIITSAYIAMRPNGSVDADYMCYLLKAYDYRRALHNMGKGLRKILNYSELKTKPILLPTLPEQKSIVKALNAECARIDAVIEQTRASIEEYKKLKQSVISQAVTKGIRSGRKMKDSGAEWIGEIPEEWTCEKFKYIAMVKSNLVQPDDYLDYPQVSPENIEKGSGKLLPCRTVREVGVISGNHLFFKGQVLYSKIRPKLNKVTIAPFDGLCSADMYPIETKINTEFFVYGLRADSFLSQISLITEDRVKMPKINQDELGNIPFAVPPGEEQEEIVSFLNEKCVSFERIIDKKELLIADLESYKKSLIFEYVTGKKEVL